MSSNRHISDHKLLHVNPLFETTAVTTVLYYSHQLFFYPYKSGLIAAFKK